MMFGLFRKNSASDERWPRDRVQREPGYYAVQDPYGSLLGLDVDDGRDDGRDDDWDDDYRDPVAEPSRDGGGGPPPLKNKRSRWWWFSRSAAALLFLFFLIVAWLAVTAPLSKSLEPIAPPQLTLLAADGTPIARNGAIVAEPVEMEKLPDHLAHAFLSIEDRRFYSHWGIDPRGIARAAWTGNGGGSTITQQLAKFTFLTPERSLTRKGREMLIAFWLETWLTKDEILERYLSNAYFGDNVYGLRAASLHYFYRQPENLTLAQSAMLAGLVQAPSRFAPTQHYARAAKRMDMVVGSMVAAGYLSQAQANAVRKPRLDVRTVNDLPTGTYFADWALPEARRIAGSGYDQQRLVTTLDSRLQNIARRVTSSAQLGNAQIALVAMRPNGEVVAMIGGKDYAKSPFNRVTQAKRQPGSTFKLFVWLAALRDGMEPDDLIDNSAIEEGSYRPKNAGERYSETITLADAFARSSNVAAVRLFGKLGDKAVIKTARDYGISAPLPEGDPSLALGTTSVSLLELTAAYAAVAANHYPVTPRAFAAEEQGWFEWLFGWNDSLSGSDHAAMEQMLRGAINNGTGRAAMLSGPNFGKTGTSQGNRDALFIGYAGDLVVGVWIGNDDNTPLKGISGGGLPAQIWAQFMRQAQGANAQPTPASTADPDGPVQPLDVPELDDIPLDENGSVLRIREGEGLTVTTEVEGIPLEIGLDDNGLRIDADSSSQGQGQR